MIVLGLTGSIGMGKSTTAGLFRAAGDPVFDADAMVHRLYAAGGAAVGPVGDAFPGVVKQGAIDRRALAAAVLGDADAMARLESIVHPLVREHEARFCADARDRRARIAVLDIPLLIETGRDRIVNAVVVVTASPGIQRARVMARPGMTAETFAALLARQAPDDDKRRRAHYVIDTGRGIEAAAAQVMSLRRAVLGVG